MAKSSFYLVVSIAVVYLNNPIPQSQSLESKISVEETKKTPEATTPDDYYSTLGPTPPPICGGDIRGISGTISSLNYPADYDNDLNCVWRIFGALSMVHITFDPISLPDSNCESCDWIELREGMYANSTLLAKITFSTSSYINYTTMAYPLYVQFHSDGSGVSSGFTAKFESKHPEPPECSRDFHDDFGNFSTPNYPLYYPRSADCIWKFYAPQDKVVQIEFHHGAVIDHNLNCDSDFLEIRDGFDPTSTLLAKICGVYIFLPPITSTSNHVWARFHSQDSGGEQGFSASYRFVPPGNLPTPNSSTASPGMLINKAIICLSIFLIGQNL
jgi:hypothetical protein